MWNVDNKGWILVNNKILNLSLIERIVLESNSREIVEKNCIMISFDSGEIEWFEYDSEEMAIKEFNIIKKSLGFR